MSIKVTPKEDSAVADKEGRLQSFRRADDWERLAILEVRVNDHGEDIEHLILNQSKLSSSLESINRTLLTIRTALYTSVGLLALLQLGFKDFISAIL